MKETMGQIIRRLRKERNFTQEELAEQLGITSQAVSRWENETGMPDISQIVPLANVFNVNTDILFGMNGKNSAEEVQKIIVNAFSKVTSPATRESLKEWYDELKKGLEIYPNNITILMQYLEAGISLSYPENDVFDPKNGKDIYEECVRAANIVIKYGENTTDILRAHMIMVLLHSAYGNYDQAEKHAQSFPWRADMTSSRMKAYISHFKKDIKEENLNHQNDLFMRFESMLDTMVDIGCCYYRLEEYGKAEESFVCALALIELICKNEPVCPRFHVRECGDIYFLIADVYLKQGKNDEALSFLEKMVDYTVDETPKFVSGIRMKTALLCESDFNMFWPHYNYKEALLLKLENPILNPLKETERFAALLKKAHDMP